MDEKSKELEQNTPKQLPKRKLVTPVVILLVIMIIIIILAILYGQKIYDV